MVLVFLTPPLQTFDELSHYYHGWLVAQGKVVVPPSGHVRLPAGAEALTNAFPTGPLAFRLQKVTLGSLEAGLAIPMGSRWVTAASTTSSYGPTGYLPQAVGIDLVRLVRGPPLAALYAARLLNLIAAVLLTYFGLRMLPFAKLPVALVALLPMSVMEMASLSADAVLIGGSIFFTGLVLRGTTRAVLPRRDLVLFMLSAVLLLTAKPGYALLSLLLLLLLPRQFPSRLAYVATLAVSIAGSLLFTAGFMLLTPDTTEFAAQFLGADNAIDAVGQLRGILTDPASFVGVLVTTVDELGVFFLRQSVAAYAWGQHNIGDAVMLVAAAGVAAVLAAGEKVDFRAWRRAVLFAVALLTALTVSVALYLTWTDLGAARIEGLQGRYFIPCYVLGLIGLAGFPFGKRWLVPAIVTVVVAVLLVTNLLTLVFYYY